MNATEQSSGDSRSRSKTPVAPVGNCEGNTTGVNNRSTRQRVIGRLIASLTQVAQTKDSAVSASSAAAAPSTTSAPPIVQVDQKPAHDVVAGAMARAASQSTVHPLDTMKVRMQAGNLRSKVEPGKSAGRLKPAQGVSSATPSGPSSTATVALRKGLLELRELYKGVIGAAAGAGIIIGTYFAFYSTTKCFLKEKTNLHEGTRAFIAGATAAIGSSVVKVPLAVCIRSVQAGVYKNVFQAASSIVQAAGIQGLFTGFLPTLLEDVPDMAVKFATYETLRHCFRTFNNNQPPTAVEDLIIGGTAGAAAAAATTPLDVVKTVMMCNASSRPTIVSAAQQIGSNGPSAFFRGIGPRALSNGLNSAIFFCFFEAFRQVLVKQQMQQTQKQLVSQYKPTGSRVGRSTGCTSQRTACLSLALPISRLHSLHTG